MIYVIKPEYDRHTTCLGGYKFMSRGGYYFAELVELDDRFCQGWYYKFKDDKNYFMHISTQIAESNPSRGGFLTSEVHTWNSLTREEKDLILMLNPERAKEFGCI